VHPSPDAEKMRAEIVQLVAVGRTEDEIVERYVSQYGERILREPRGARLAVLILTPLTAFVAGAAWLLLYLAHRRQATLPEIASAVLPAIPENEMEW
jgi:cytochrome c-type biogenesis protein CcmH/NrfF